MPDRQRAEPRLPDGGAPLPRGLVLFPAGSSPRHRRRRAIFLAVFLLVALGLVWPVYPWASRAFPLVFGLPLSFAWVVAMLIVQFATLLWLYLGEEDRR